MQSDTIKNKIKHKQRCLSLASIKAISSPRIALDSPNYGASTRLNAQDIKNHYLRLPEPNKPKLLLISGLIISFVCCIIVGLLLQVAY
jgi:hypothetical protein